MVSKVCLAKRALIFSVGNQLAPVLTSHSLMGPSSVHKFKTLMMRVQFVSLKKKLLEGFGIDGMGGGEGSTQSILHFISMFLNIYTEF